MNYWTVLASLMFLSLPSFSITVAEQKVQKATNWHDFQLAMDKLQTQDQQRGTSYIISGTIVTIGGIAATHATQDIATKLVYGIASSAGIAAITYGIANIYYGNNYNSFYNSLKATDLSEYQRNQLVKNFLASEDERRQNLRRMQMYGHYLASALNIYAASQEKDPNAKTFFSVLAGLNLALGISFSF